MLKVRDGCCQVGLGKIGLASATVGSRVFRIQTDRLTVVLNRAAVIAFLMVRDATVVVRVCVTRVQVNGFVEFLDCPVVFFLV